MFLSKGNKNAPIQQNAIIVNFKNILTEINYLSVDNTKNFRQCRLSRLSYMAIAGGPNCL